MTRSAYAPPFDSSQLPTSRADWRRRTGLTDPAIIAAAVEQRVHGSERREPRYVDFFVG
jgi:hypothetical protein